MERTYKKIDMDTVISMIKDHHLWLSSDGKKGKQAVFTGYDLSGLDSDYAKAGYIVPPFWEQALSNIDLSYSNLSGLYFRDVDLSSANFQGASLRNAKFYQVMLFDADFSEADISETNIEESFLIRANLTKANLSDADVNNSRLEDANLQDANCQNTNFQHTKLQGANLYGADFRGANFLGATIEENQLTHIRFAKNIEFSLAGANIVSLQAQESSVDEEIRQLKEKLKQVESKSKSDSQNNQIKNDQLRSQLEQKEEEKNRISERLKKLEKELDVLKEGRNQRIQDAKSSLANALINTDNQIKNNENTARLFKWLGIVLFGMSIFLLINFGSFVACLPELFVEKKLNILFYTFPIITLMVIGTTCLRHQKNLLAEVRHFSNMKHQIELYSGLLEASQHAAASFNNPEKADEYVQETFTQIRNRLLNSQYLPDNSSADKQWDNDSGTDKVLDLLNKIADLSGKKSMGN